VCYNIYLGNDFGDSEARAVVLFTSADNDVGGELSAVLDRFVAARTTLINNDAVHTDHLLWDVQASFVVLSATTDDQIIRVLGVGNHQFIASGAALCLLEVQYFGLCMVDDEARAMILCAT